MNPVCFHLFGRPVYWYGIFVALAFLAGLAHLTLLGRRRGYSSSFVSDLGFWMMLSGIAGARAAYVLANLDEFLAAPGLIPRIDKGGLIFYGGFIGAAVAAILYARVKRAPLAAFGDFTITALPLGQALGRIGCLLNGCCYGRPGALPWCLASHDAVRHPVQVYEAAFCLLIYGVLVWTYLRRARPGRVLALYLMLYPAARFITEFWRGDERLHWLGMNAAQLVSLLLAAAGLALWVGLPASRPTPRRAP